MLKGVSPVPLSNEHLRGPLLTSICFGAHQVVICCCPTRTAARVVLSWEQDFTLQQEEVSLCEHQSALPPRQPCSWEAAYGNYNCNVPYRATSRGPDYSFSPSTSASYLVFTSKESNIELYSTPKYVPVIYKDHL